MAKAPPSIITDLRLDHSTLPQMHDTAVSFGFFHQSHGPLLPIWIRVRVGDQLPRELILDVSHDATFNVPWSVNDITCLDALAHHALSRPTIPQVQCYAGFPSVQPIDSGYGHYEYSICKRTVYDSDLGSYVIIDLPHYICMGCSASIPKYWSLGDTPFPIPTQSTCSDCRNRRQPRRTWRSLPATVRKDLAMYYWYRVIATRQDPSLNDIKKQLRWSSAWNTIPKRATIRDREIMIGTSHANDACLGMRKSCFTNTKCISLTARDSKGREISEITVRDIDTLDQTLALALVLTAWCRIVLIEPNDITLRFRRLNAKERWRILNAYFQIEMNFADQADRMTLLEVQQMIDDLPEEDEQSVEIWRMERLTMPFLEVMIMDTGQEVEHVALPEILSRLEIDHGVHRLDLQYLWCAVLSQRARYQDLDRQSHNRIWSGHSDSVIDGWRRRLQCDAYDAFCELEFTIRCLLRNSLETLQSGLDPDGTIRRSARESEIWLAMFYVAWAELTLLRSNILPALSEDIGGGFLVFVQMLSVHESILNCEMDILENETLFFESRKPDLQDLVRKIWDKEACMELEVDVPHELVELMETIRNRAFEHWEVQDHSETEDKETKRSLLVHQAMRNSHIFQRAVRDAYVHCHAILGWQSRATEASGSSQ